MKLEDWIAISASFNGLFVSFQLFSKKCGFHLLEELIFLGNVV